MKELIKIRKSAKTGNPIVNARDLHAFLEVGKEFANWFKDRVKKYGFVENVDYTPIFFDVKGVRIPLAKNGKLRTSGFQKVFRIEYAITLDCAKELSMVQNNEKGREARRYFIDVDKKYRALKEELVRKPEILFTMSETAKILNLSDYYGKVGRNALFNILYFQKIVNEKNRALKKYVDKGYFVNYPTRVTEEGLKWLNQRFSVEVGGDVSGLKKEIEDLKKNQKVQEEKQSLMLSGITSVVETLYFNKGGSKTEEQNRMAIEHLRGFLERVKHMPKELKEGS